MSARVTVIDTAKRAAIKQIPLPDGSTLLRGICVSPDGKFACVTHSLGRYNLPTSQSEHGWINNNALSILDLRTLGRLNTVLLDEPDNGAANPWAVAWSADGEFLCVTHTGSQELSIIDARALVMKLQGLREPADASNDLSFMAGLRSRVKVRGNGPRSLVLAGHKAYVANYFSDSISEFDLVKPQRAPVTVALDTPADVSRVRLGELLFNDATISFQSWHSCASCHSSDGRTDALNWDLLNDGIGNPKNARSLLHSFETPPAMALGVRANAAAAIRAGIRGTMFATVPEDYSSALDEYVHSLRPIPSPHLVAGKLSPAAERGQQLFFSEPVGCAECHLGPLFTNLKPYDVGTSGPLDGPKDRFYTPTLIEIWRTAPYLHDGSAASLREVLTRCNSDNRHGRTTRLSAAALEDLVAYLLSL